MSSDDNAPLEWIQLELIPLANFENEFSTMLLWWNPVEGILEGAKPELLAIIDKAMHAGSIESQQGASIEITDPLKKTTELAAILAQYFWVVPQPVSNAYEKVDGNGSDELQSSIQ